MTALLCVVACSYSYTLHCKSVEQKSRDVPSLHAVWRRRIIVE